MRLLLPLAAIALIGAAGPSDGGADTVRAERAAKAEAELAKALDGREAGPAVACINSRDIRSTRNIGKRTILYTMNSRLIYRNDPPGGCDGPGLGRTLITRTPSTSLCRGEIARVVDLTSGFEGPSCQLGDFVPYRKPR